MVHDIHFLINKDGFARKRFKSYIFSPDLKEVREVEQRRARGKSFQREGAITEKDLSPASRLLQ